MQRIRNTAEHWGQSLQTNEEDTGFAKDLRIAADLLFCGMVVPAPDSRLRQTATFRDGNPATSSKTQPS